MYNLIQRLREYVQSIRERHLGNQKIESIEQTTYNPTPDSKSLEAQIGSSYNLKITPTRDGKLDISHVSFNPNPKHPFYPKAMSKGNPRDLIKESTYPL